MNVDKKFLVLELDRYDTSDKKSSKQGYLGEGHPK